MITFLASSEAFKIITTTEVLVVLNYLQRLQFYYVLQASYEKYLLRKLGLLGNWLTKTGKFDKRCKRKSEKIMLS